MTTKPAADRFVFTGSENGPAPYFDDSVRTAREVRHVGGAGDSDRQAEPMWSANYNMEYPKQAPGVLNIDWEI